MEQQSTMYSKGIRIKTIRCEAKLNEQIRAPNVDEVALIMAEAIKRLAATKRIKPAKYSARHWI